MSREIENNRPRRLLRVFAVLGVLACGVAAIRAAHANPFGDFIQPYVYSQVDKYFPGGDNKPAKAIADLLIGVVTVDPDKAAMGFAKVFGTPSSTVSNEDDTPRDTIHDQQVVPVSPSNENAVPVHNPTTDHPERPTAPQSEPSVGVSPPPPDVRGPLVSLSPFLSSAIGQVIEAAREAQMEAQHPIAHLGTGFFGGGAGSLFEGPVGATGSVPSGVGVSHAGGDHGQSNGGAVAHGGGYAGRDTGAAGHTDTMVANR